MSRTFTIATSSAIAQTDYETRIRTAIVECGVNENHPRLPYAVKTITGMVGRLNQSLLQQRQPRGVGLDSDIFNCKAKVDGVAAYLETVGIERSKYLEFCLAEPVLFVSNPEGIVRKLGYLQESFRQGRFHPRGSKLPLQQRGDKHAQRKMILTAFRRARQAVLSAPESIFLRDIWAVFAHREEVTQTVFLRTPMAQIRRNLLGEHGEAGLVTKKHPIVLYAQSAGGRRWTPEEAANMVVRALIRAKMVEGRLN